MRKKYKLVFVALFILCSAGFFYYTVEQEQDVAPKTTVSSKTVTPVSQGAAYYMKLVGSQVVIYRADHSVFEYTDLNREVLPESIIKELLAGKYFQNEAELYEFLETYTS